MGQKAEFQDWKYIAFTEFYWYRTFIIFALEYPNVMKKLTEVNATIV